MTRLFAPWLCALLFVFPGAAARAVLPSWLQAVSISPAFFNPSLGQQETIRLGIARPGWISVSILDRDRFVIRRLGERNVRAGETVLAWDGKDDAAAVVPDEAYSMKIEWKGPGPGGSYDPSAHFTPVLEEPASRSYSRWDGVLNYTLSRPSRVHVQAGQAKKNAATGEVEGPILKTIVDRAPRVAGAVIEKWNGMDESGAVSVPDLPDFAVSILAASLPDNSLITVGNRRQGFRQYARNRRPREAVQARVHTKAAVAPHHSGLNAFEDWSPGVVLTLIPAPAGQGEGGSRVWVVDRPLRVKAEIAEDPAHFLNQPTELIAFVDEQPILRRERPPHPLELTIDPARLSPGEHRLVVNWASELGPVAVGVARIVVRTHPSEGTE
jgi:hypothetical protein